MTQNFIKNLHKSFYDGLPDACLTVKSKKGEVVFDHNNKPMLVRPGEYRAHPVQVGSHIAPDSCELGRYMGWLEAEFDLNKIHGARRIVAAAALHHRLAWIHPFQDGNGRVI